MPEIQIPSIVILGLQVVLAFTGAFALALWLSLIVWTFRDARARSRDVFAVLLGTLMVVLFGPLGLLLYFLLRPQVTLAELYERSLEEEALLQDLEEQHRCPGCSRLAEDNWLVCPDCHTQLKKKCHHCDELLNLKWNLCPCCGTAQTNVGAVDLRVASGGSVPYNRPSSQPSSPKPRPVPKPISEPTQPPPPLPQAPEADLSPDEQERAASTTRPIPISAAVEADTQPPETKDKPADS